VMGVLAAAVLAASVLLVRRRDLAS
jgi:hypothetical protein